tara:strand:+ start:2980 stop:4041 length:1062 start_codon:yes stop_codon:yes gene_type:complete
MASPEEQSNVIIAYIAYGEDSEGVPLTATNIGDLIYEQGFKLGDEAAGSTISVSYPTLTGAAARSWKLTKIVCNEFKAGFWKINFQYSAATSASSSNKRGGHATLERVPASEVPISDVDKEKFVSQYQGVYKYGSAVNDRYWDLRDDASGTTDDISSIGTASNGWLNLTNGKGNADLATQVEIGAFYKVTLIAVELSSASERSGINNLCGLANQAEISFYNRKADGSSELLESFPQNSLELVAWSVGSEPYYKTNDGNGNPLPENWLYEYTFWFWNSRTFYCDQRPFDYFIGDDGFCYPFIDSSSEPDSIMLIKKVNQVDMAGALDGLYMNSSHNFVESTSLITNNPYVQTLE